MVLSSDVLRLFVSFRLRAFWSFSEGKVAFVRRIWSSFAPGDAVFEVVLFTDSAGVPERPTPAGWLAAPLLLFVSRDVLSFCARNSRKPLRDVEPVVFSVPENLSYQAVKKVPVVRTQSTVFLHSPARRSSKSFCGNVDGLVGSPASEEIGRF